MSWLSIVVVLGACTDGKGDPIDSSPVTVDDDDGDGVAADEGDCNDDDPSIHPGASESCNGLDDNCDGTVDEGLEQTFYADTDGDTYGDAASSVVDCDAPPGHVANDDDCNDGDSSIQPGSLELCDPDDVDEDCSGAADDDDPGVAGQGTWFTDADHDGYGDDTTALTQCDIPPGRIANAGDCDDDDPAVNPSAQEICDGLARDEDCDTKVDDDDPSSAKADYWPDGDGDGFGDASVAELRTCFDPGTGYVTNGDDCADDDAAVNPAAVEICDPSDADEDCSGAADDADPGVTDAGTYYDDGDGDSYGDGATATVLCDQPLGSVTNANDCDDGDDGVNPAADEVCDGLAIDDDCDGLVDDDDPETVPSAYWPDVDGDTYGDATVTPTTTCQDLSATQVLDGSDCDDSDALVNPDADEDCDDAIDNDCNGVDDDCSIGQVSLATADLIVNGTASYSYSGIDLADVGDVTGDGVPDLAIGAYGTSSYKGAVHILETATGTTTVATSRADISGVSNYDYVGYAIGGPGDVDADGNADLLVGSYVDDHAYLFYGPLTADTTTASTGAVFSSAVTNDYLGQSVDLLNDWDGDGYGEVVALAPYAERTGTYSSGVAYVWTGPVTGALAASSADYAIGGSSYDYLGIGSSRAALGDMNGDGLDDLALGAPYRTVGTTYDAGTVFVVFGGSASSGSNDVAAIADATITGTASYGYFGSGMAGRADYDGDGSADLVVGAYAVSTVYPSAGATYVFLGSLSGTATALTSHARLDGASNYDYSGRCVASGDVNGDGKSDLLVGATGHDTVSLSSAGGAYLVLGPVSGMISLADAYGIFEGSAAYMSAGARVDFLADWDGDGLDEIAVGAESVTNGMAYSSGRTAVFSGATLSP